MVNLGLAGRMAVKQKATQLCQRCGLRYPKDESACLHCKDISTEAELQRFKEKIDGEREAGRSLGKIFIILALILGVLVLLSLLRMAPG